MQAGEPGTFYGIYHICINDKDSIFQAFENFASRIIDEQNQWQRTSTENYLDIDGAQTMKIKKI